MIILDTAAWQNGIRMAIIVVVPILIGALTGHIALSIMALLSGFATAFADVGGAYQKRALSMFSAAVFMTVTALVATITGANPWLVTLLMFAWAFFGSIVGLYGNLAGKVGFSTTLVFIIIMGQPASIGEAWLRVLAFIGGAAWSMAISLWIWPFRPFHPARQAVSGYYQAMSVLLRKASQRELGQHWHEGVKQERARLQGAHEKAHQIVAGRRSQRSDAHPFNSLLLMLVLQADSLMEAVIALAEELAVARTQNYHQDEQSAFVQTMEQCAALLEQLAHTIADEKQALRPETLERSLSAIETQEYALRASLPQLEKDYYALANTCNLESQLDPQHSLVHKWLSFRLVNTRNLANLLKRLSELLRETRDLLTQADGQEILKEMLQAEATSKGKFSWKALTASVREQVSLFKDNLTLRSFPLRHALRLATISAVAVAIAKLLHIPDGSWIAVNILFILRPDYGSTRKHTIQRILGTVIGAILGTLLITVLHINFLTFPVLIVLAFFCFAYQENNQTLFIQFFTTFLIIVFHLIMPGNGLVPLIRIATTLVGGGMCILASYLFWPLWEHERLPQQMGRTILANRAYIASVLAAYRANGDKKAELEAVRQASKNAHVQNMNAATAFQRLLYEQKASENEIERFHILVTYNQRFCDSVTALAAHISTRPEHDEFHQLERFRQQIQWMLRDIEEAIRGRKRPGVNPSFKDTLSDVLGLLQHLLAAYPAGRAIIEGHLPQVPQALALASAPPIQGTEHAAAHASASHHMQLPKHQKSLHLESTKQFQHVLNAGANAPSTPNQGHQPHPHSPSAVRGIRRHLPYWKSGWLKAVAIIFVIGAILLGALVGLGITVWAPSLSLNGSSRVALGSTLTLHGSNFLSNSSITLTRDNGTPLYVAQHADPAQLTHESGRTGASAGYFRQALLSDGASNVVSASGDGTFTITLQIDQSLSFGQHVIYATEAPTHRSISLAFTVISSQVLATPTPTFTPSPTTAPTLSSASAATVTITSASRQVSNTFTINGVMGRPNGQQVQARMLSAATQTVSQTVNTTGQGMTSGSSATGTLLIYNNSNNPMTVTAGSVYPCNDSCSSPISSLHIIVDQTVTIPANSQITGIPGHIQEVGTVGNLDQNGFHFHNDLEIENDSAFTGGTNPQFYTYVQQSDIDNAANGLISASQPGAQQVLQRQVHANERFVGTPQCTPNTPNANHQAGDYATTVTVSVNFTCTGKVYDYNGALSLARQLLRKQAANNPDSAYALTGQISVSLQRASFNGQTVTLLVAAKGLWVYQISAAQRQAWANLVVGQSPQAAQTRLARQQGVTRVTIRLIGANAQVLPTDAQKITVVVQTVPEF